MRRWLIVGGLLWAIAIAAAAMVARRAATVLEAGRERLAAEATAALGRAVRLGHIGVSLRHGIGVRLRDVRIAEDTRVGEGDFLRVPEVLIVPQLWAALSGRWVVRRVVLDRPEVRIVRTRAGLNIDSLGTDAGEERRAGGRIQLVLAAARTDGQAGMAFPQGAPRWGGLQRLAAERVVVRDGTVYWVDRTIEPPFEQRIRSVTVRAADLSLVRPVQIDASAVLFGEDRPDVSLRGQVGPLGSAAGLATVPFDVTVLAQGMPLAALRAWRPGLVPEGASAWPALGGQVRLGGTLRTARVEGQLGAGSLAVEFRGTIAVVGDREADLVLVVPRTDLRALAPVVPALGRPGVSGAVEANVHLRGPIALESVPSLTGTVGLVDATFGVDGPGGITTTIRLESGAIELPPTRLELGEAAMEVSTNARHAGRQLWLEPLRIEGFGGRIQATGHLDARDLAAVRASVEGTLDGLSASKVLALLAPDAADRLQGRLNGEFALSVGGTAPDAWRQTLAGLVRLELSDAIIRGFNLVESVLDGVIPAGRGMLTLIPPRVRYAHPELFGAHETRMHAMRLRSRLAARVAHIDELVAHAPAWELEATGTAALGGPLDLQGTFTAQRAITTDIERAVREVQWLLDDAGRLAIPFRLSGVPPHLRAVPDPRFVGRALQRGLAERGLGALLGR